LRGGWSKLRKKVMLTVVRSKFARDPDITKKLLITGKQNIVEGHTGDMYWGGKRNHLGKIIMKVRNEMIEAEIKSSIPTVFPVVKTKPKKRKRRKRKIKTDKVYI